MYSDITSNKRKTWVLVSLFSFFTVIIVGIAGIIAGIDPAPALILGALFSIAYSTIAFFVADKTVLFTEGASKVTKDEAPEIYRIVENLTIANGMPMPAIYIINDDAPNAFATGRDPKHASIAITTGLLRRLEKIELEGVIAHELSHIKNYDIRLMTIVVVFVGLITLVGNIILRVQFFGRAREKNNQAAIIFLVAGLILAILSPIIAQIIKLAVSRTREYLADASGALLTRHPEGLASALRKISDYNEPMRKASNATAHLYIANPFGSKKNRNGSWYSKIFSTHPPITERVARLNKMGG